MLFSLSPRFSDSKDPGKFLGVRLSCSSIRVFFQKISSPNILPQNLNYRLVEDPK